MDDRIGTPERKLSEEDSNSLAGPVTFQKLENNISDLNISKAKLLDRVTNDIIKVLPLSG